MCGARLTGAARRPGQQFSGDGAAGSGWMRPRSQLITPPASRISIWRGDRSCRSRIVALPPRTVAVISRPAASASADAGDLHRVAHLQPVVVGQVLEGQRQDAEIYEVLPVDPGEALGQHDLQPEIARGERGVLAARALAVIQAADDGVAGALLAALLRPLRVGVVDRLEGELARLRDVRP